MNNFSKEREVEWIIEGTRLKKLREDSQMSRAELARQMNTSDARLARLENGEGVRNSPTLGRFYELIIKHQKLVEELEVLNNDWEKLMQCINKSKKRNINLAIAEGTSNQQKLKKTRLNTGKRFYI
ncbi:hypothetical protein BK128_09265 [Viridibacillus sp. FSL H7-0596]|uniref:helix-turn-helix domain-containing protein n=1 Tax=Viridibacillus sp. FSL H7-0596 TaxID=1928923 RepID=UPI00096D8F29|nr:helix-turn-helix transcriptional regulator [Viridibacillus sp. FSL H7-0596]OMC86849.1 hypothetical protein BK128_09265 [Viridibacillus sp. FSL H7-0596]